MKEEINTDGMEMPTPCIHCGGWFDLLDGYGSEKWHLNTTICKSCYREEEKEIERDDDIQDLKDSLYDAEYTVKNCRKRLKEFGIEMPDELEQLRQWKESAMKVTPPLQEIGQELGVKLGDSIHDKILPGIRALKRAAHQPKKNIEPHTPPKPQGDWQMG